MSAVSTKLITITSLAAGASSTVSHGLLDSSGSGLIPTVIQPDRNTPISAVSATATSITFTNNGDQAETAVFWVHHSHSINGVSENQYWKGSSASSFLLATPQWDDLRVPVTATKAFGSNPPAFAKFLDDGTVSAGFAANFNGSSSKGVIADFGDFSADYSLVAWFNTTNVAVPERIILSKAGSFTLGCAGGKVRFAIPGLGTLTSTTAFIPGDRNLVAVVVDEGTTTTEITLWINGVISDHVVWAGTLPADNTNTPIVGSEGTSKWFSGSIDEVRFYQALLSETDVGEIWNLGVGTTDEPTSTPTLLAGYHFDAQTGADYSGNALTMTLTAVTFVSGLTNSAATRGVATFLFDNSGNQELYFTAQLPHGYKEGTDLEVHVHWSPISAAAGDVSWGMEFSLAAISGVLPATSVITGTVAAGGVANKHKLTDLGTISGVGLGISSMILGRVFRPAGSHTSPVALLEIDFHYQLNSLGSRQETIK